jgi:hypothetical protein
MPWEGEAMQNLHRRPVVTGVAALVLFTLGLIAVAYTSSVRSTPAPAPERLDRALPVAAGALTFEPNLGQAADGVSFLSRGDGYAAFLTHDGIVLGMRDPTDADPASPLRGLPPTMRTRWAVVGMTFLGASRDADIMGKDPIEGVSNYFDGNDPSGWITDVPHYSRVAYRDLYEGVDLTYYGNREGHLEFDLIVAPHVDPQVIRFGYSGATLLSVDASGALVLRVPGGEIRQPKPEIYQWIDGARREVSGGYVLLGSQQVGIRVASFDPSVALVIDPAISYATYLGGSSDEFPIWSDIDASGNFYVTGVTLSPDFPTTPGAFQARLGGGADAFVSKLDPSGSHLVYSTYLGGSFDDVAIGLDADSSGNVVVTGFTASPQFPVTSGAYQTHFGGGFSDVFVTKLDASGSRLIFSTFLGGNGSDTGFISFFGSGGTVYVEGDTGSRTFPTTPGAFQRSFAGGDSDGFVTKMNPTGSSLVYSTFVGGSGFDGAHDGVLDGAGNFYIDGPTDSGNFPVTPSAFQPANAGGGTDAFVAKVNPTGSNLTYASYLGGSGDEDVLDMTIDGSGNAYVPGLTSSADFPTTPGSFQTSAGGGDLDGYLTKVNATGSALVYSTYLGTDGFDVAGTVRVDRSGNAHVAGITDSPDFPLTRNAFQPVYGGGPGDAFVLTLSRDGSRLLFSSFLGGSGDDGTSGSGSWLDASGNLYLSGSTSSTDFPVTGGAFHTTAAGGYDVFLVKIALGKPSATSAGPGQSSASVDLDRSLRPRGRGSIDAWIAG